ncbi:MAG: class I SAM-dependent methyltransferase [Actinomycetota bacterium]|nr:class I SAM-dependent methyltransferase [Actinomycetota bacterium]
MALPPDYDSDPERWGSWRAPQDVQEAIAPELSGPVLDVGCGDGRLAEGLEPGVYWVGVDASPSQLASTRHRPVVLADMRALPFRDAAFAEVTHLWCLYHVEEPRTAIEEAKRVLSPAGRYFACTNARTSDPELMWDGYPSSSFDAEDAVVIVAAVFNDVEVESWDQPFVPMETRDEVRAFCRHHFIPLERAETVDLPLWLTKRGALVRARTSDGST